MSLTGAAGVEVLAACSPGEVRALAVRDGVVLDVAIHRAGAGLAVGTRVRAHVGAVVPAMAGCFVALPGGLEGFLPDSAGGAGLTDGEAVTVQVTRAALGGKGPRLARTAGPEGPGPGAIERLLALHPQASVVVDDPAAALGIEARVVPRAWDDAAEAAFDALAHPVEALPGGLRASIHPTPALVAIDMDMAGATGERRGKAAAQREANRAALPGLARAIRLRNLSGAILIDLAGMAVKARAALAGDVAAALAHDPLRPRFLGFTALGLAEISRPRVHPPLHELLAGPHAAGLAALRAMVRLPPPARPALRAAPDVVRALDDDAAARADLARRTGRALVMRPDPALPPGHWVIDDA